MAKGRLWRWEIGGSVDTGRRRGENGSKGNKAASAAASTSGGASVGDADENGNDRGERETIRAFSKLLIWTGWGISIEPV